MDISSAISQENIEVYKKNPPIFGSGLKEALNSEFEHIEYFADQLIPKRSITMVSASPGIGKSTLISNLIASLSAGTRIFGHFETRPTVIYYIQMERDKMEILKRLKSLKDIIEPNYARLYIDDQMQGYNAMVPEHRQAIIDRIRFFCPLPQLIIVDPIYQLCPGLSRDENASTFAKFIQQLQFEFNCAIWLNHHTHREKYANDGKEIEETDAFYGSQWLKALVTGSFSMRKTDNGCILVNNKDNWSCLTATIPLMYHPENDLLTFDIDNPELGNEEKIKAWIDSIKDISKTFTFDEIKSILSCATRTLRRLLAHHEIRGRLIEVKGKRGKKLYRVKEA